MNEKITLCRKFTDRASHEQFFDSYQHNQYKNNGYHKWNPLNPAWTNYKHKTELLEDIREERSCQNFKAVLIFFIFASI